MYTAQAVKDEKEDHFGDDRSPPSWRKTVPAEKRPSLGALNT